MFNNLQIPLQPQPYLVALIISSTIQSSLLSPHLVCPIISFEASELHVSHRKNSSCCTPHIHMQFSHSSIFAGASSHNTRGSPCALGNHRQCPQPLPVRDLVPQRRRTCVKPLSRDRLWESSLHEAVGWRQPSDLNQNASAMIQLFIVRALSYCHFVRTIINRLVLVPDTRTNLAGSKPG
jgi:hypothetical protein